MACKCQQRLKMFLTARGVLHLTVPLLHVDHGPLHCSPEPQHGQDQHRKVPRLQRGGLHRRAALLVSGQRGLQSQGQVALIQPQEKRGEHP